MDSSYKRRHGRSYDDEEDRGRRSRRDDSRDRRRSRSRSRRHRRDSRRSRSDSSPRSKSRSRSDSRKRETKRSPVEVNLEKPVRRSRFSDLQAIAIPPSVPAAVPALSGVFAAQQNLQLLAAGTSNAALTDLFSIGANSLLKLALPVGPKESRELFVGNVAQGVSEVIVKDFLNAAMRQVGFGSNSTEPISGCRMNAKFCFIECWTVEDCNNALNLNGIPFMGQSLKIARPSKYAGPITPAKTWQELTGQAAASTTDETATTATSSTPFSDPNTKLYREIFIGNTSPDTTDIALKEFVGGALQKMGLSSSGSENPVHTVRANGRYCFAEFRTMEDAANSLNLNSIPFLGQALKFSRPSKFDSPALVNYLTWDELFSRWSNGDLKLMTAGAPSKVLRITNMVTISELHDQNVFAEVAEDTATECAQYGTVRSVIIPRPDDLDRASLGLAGGIDKGVGSVFVEMSSPEEATKALLQLKGRTFNARFVDVKFYPEDDFARGEYGTDPPKIVITAAGPTSIDKVVVVQKAQQQQFSHTPTIPGLGLGADVAALLQQQQQQQQAAAVAAASLAANLIGIGAPSSSSTAGASAMAPQIAGVAHQQQHQQQGQGHQGQGIAPVSASTLLGLGQLWNQHQHQG